MVGGVGVGAGATAVGVGVDAARRTMGSAMAAVTWVKALDSCGPAKVTTATAATDARASSTAYSTRACPDFWRARLRACVGSLTTP